RCVVLRHPVSTSCVTLPLPIFLREELIFAGYMNYLAMSLCKLLGYTHTSRLIIYGKGITSHTHVHKSRLKCFRHNDQKIRTSLVVLSNVMLFIVALLAITYSIRHNGSCQNIQDPK